MAGGQKIGSLSAGGVGVPVNCAQSAARLKGTPIGKLAIGAKWILTRGLNKGSLWVAGVHILSCGPLFSRISH